MCGWRVLGCQAFNIGSEWGSMDLFAAGHVHRCSSESSQTTVPMWCDRYQPMTTRTWAEPRWEGVAR